LKITKANTAILIFLLLLPACSKGPGNSSSKSGEIEYGITYIENDLKKVTGDMLPKKMVTKFHNNGFEFEIEGVFGLFKISNTVIPKKDINETRLSVLDKHFYYSGELNEPAIGFGAITKPKLKYTKETKEICGYTCHKVIATFPGETKPLTIYYTKDIPIKNPNRTTPYNEIDGVLMEFYLQLHNIRMKLIATEVFDKEVPEGAFTKTGNYKRTGKKYLEAVLFKLLDTE